MTFPQSNTSNNNVYATTSMNYEDAASLIPSIYSSQKKHITSTEWADKASDWVKVKQANETMWNTFGISPAPKVDVNNIPIMPVYTQPPNTLETTTNMPEDTANLSNDSFSEDKSSTLINVNNISVNMFENKMLFQSNESKEIESTTNSSKNELIETQEIRKKLVPNWIKSVKSIRNTLKKTENNSKEMNIFGNDTDNKLFISDPQIEFKKKIINEKLQTLSNEFTSIILLQITTSLIENVCRKTYDTITLQSKEYSSSKKIDSTQNSDYNKPNNSYVDNKSVNIKDKNRSKTNTHDNNSYKKKYSHRHRSNSSSRSNSKRYRNKHSRRSKYSSRYSRRSRRATSSNSDNSHHLSSRSTSSSTN